MKLKEIKYLLSLLKYAEEDGLLVAAGMAASLNLDINFLTRRVAAFEHGFDPGLEQIYMEFSTRHSCLYEVGYWSRLEYETIYKLTESKCYVQVLLFGTPINFFLSMAEEYIGNSGKTYIPCHQNVKPIRSLLQRGLYFDLKDASNVSVFRKLDTGRDSMKFGKLNLFAI